HLEMVAERIVEVPPCPSTVVADGISRDRGPGRVAVLDYACPVEPWSGRTPLPLHVIVVGHRADDDEVRIFRAESDYRLACPAGCVPNKQKFLSLVARVLVNRQIRDGLLSYH